MRILRCTVPIELVDSYNIKTLLQENLNYIVPDIVVDMIKDSIYGDKIVRNDDFFEVYSEKEYTGQDLTGKKLITFRNGGIGDLMFQLPSLKKLKETTGVHITVVCNKNYVSIFEGLNYIDVINYLPFTTDEIEKSDYFLSFEGLIENNPDAETYDAYVLHAHKFGVEPETQRPKLSLDEKVESEVVRELSKYKCERRIVIAWSASVAIRSVDPNVYAQLIATTPETFRFFICGSPKDIPEIKHFINQLSQFKNRITNWAEKYSDLRYSMALIKHSDVVIGPDSGLLHVAGGYEIPVIGLFGAFPSRLRLNHYKKAMGINAKSNCMFGRGTTNNCFQHGTGSCALANKKMEYFSPCMSAITHTQIIYCLTRLKIL